MSSRNLEDTIHRALDSASERRHEFVTLEHLLLGLMEDPDAIAVLRACDVDLDTLRKDLCNYLDSDLDHLVAEAESDPRPTEGFNRALQRAMIHVQSSGQPEVTGANVLVAIFSERESYAVFFLQEQGMTRFDAVNYISHGIAKIPGLIKTRGPDRAEHPIERSRNLEATLQRAVDLAKDKRHEAVTLGHLLLALANDSDAAEVLRACDADLDKLREDLHSYLDNDLDDLVSDRPSDPRPKESFNRALQRAMVHVQSSGREEVTGANVLVAIFSERESHAVNFLKEQNISRFDAVNYISDGMATVPELSETDDPDRLDLSIERSQSLQATLQRAVDLAKEKQHQDVTLEHLLLALTEDPDAVAVLHACAVEFDELRADLVNFLDRHLDYLVAGSLSVPRMTQRLVHFLLTAAKRKESAGGEALTGADVLAELIFQKGSFAAFFLRERKLTASDAIRFTVGRPATDDTP